MTQASKCAYCGSECDLCVPSSLGFSVCCSWQSPLWAQDTKTVVWVPGQGVTFHRTRHAVASTLVTAPMQTAEESPPWHTVCQPALFHCLSKPSRRSTMPPTKKLLKNTFQWYELPCGLPASPFAPGHSGSSAPAL